MSGRYSRQIALPQIGPHGQSLLSQARVLIVGAGGLGSPIALYLAGAGVGTIGIADDDCVSLDNLQRQVLYDEASVGEGKALKAAERLRALNSSVTVVPHQCRLAADNARSLISGYDIVVDGCDNFATRYLIDDVCRELGKVYIYGAISDFTGQVSVFGYGDGDYSYRKLFPASSSPSDRATGAPVLGTTPAVVGAVMALQTIKVICGFGEVLSGILWTCDLLSDEYMKIRL